MAFQMPSSISWRTVCVLLLVLSTATTIQPLHAFIGSSSGVRPVWARTQNFSWRDDFNYNSLAEMQGAGWVLQRQDMITVGNGVVTFDNDGSTNGAAAYNSFPAGLSDWSVEASTAWVGRSYGSLGVAVTTGANGNPVHSYTWDGDGYYNEFVLYRDGAKVLRFSGYAGSFNTWQVFKIEKTGTTLNLYYNGILENSYTESDNTPTTLLSIQIWGRWLSKDSYDYLSITGQVTSAPTTAVVYVYSMPLNLLGSDPATVISSDIHATVSVNYVFNGQAQSTIKSTPFRFGADVGSQVSLSVISSPSGWNFACKWDHYGFQYYDTCSLTVQVVSVAEKIAAFFQPAFDFSISVSPTSGTVQQGQSVTSTVTVTLVSGTGQAVVFSISGLPTGTTYSFSLATCNPTCSSTLTILTSSSTPKGTYSSTITGASGSLTHSATYSLTVTAVPPPSGFSISLNPTSGTVPQGQSTTSTVTATLTSGISQAVSFSASGLPFATTVSFSPTSCTPTCGSTLTISTSTNTPPGTYPITVSGTSGSLSHSATYSLTVTPLLAFDFSISVSPNSGSVVAGNTLVPAGTVTLSLLSGTTQSVSLTLSGLPSTIGTSDLNDKSCSPTCSVSFGIVTYVTASTGTYTLTITGTGGGKTKSTSYTLEVTGQDKAQIIQFDSPTGNFGVGLRLEAKVRVKNTGSEVSGLD